MGVLKSKLFTDPPGHIANRLERCALQDADHVTPGSVGEHVKRIQIALNQLSNVFLTIDGIYGAKTASAVVAFKEAQSPPLRQRGQRIADNIVGIRTIKALDEQMFIFEQFEPGEESQFVSLTEAGAKHEHTQCPTKGVTAPGRDGRPLHHGTPINPQGFARKINIGGEHETDYVGFQDFVTKTPDGLVFGPPGRPFTENLPKRCASDICMRSAPITAEIRKEINRLAVPACRFTYANDPSNVSFNRAFLLSLGTVIEDAFIFSKSVNVEQTLEVMVIVMRGDGRFVNLGDGPQVVFPPAIDF